MYYPDVTPDEEIMMHFDFQKVHDHMTAANWTYNNQGVPTLEKIKSVARELLGMVCANGSQAATGGFEVTCSGNEKRLKFVMEEHSVYVPVMGDDAHEPVYSFGGDK